MTIDRHVASFTVAPIGLGCMNLSHAYGAPPSARALDALINRTPVVGPRYNPATQAEIDTEDFTC